jgi:endonuclease/exonuclease/phosphatase family metal-dependent hydrolase
VQSLSQLQKFGTALRFDTPFLLSMGLMLLVDALHRFTTQYPVTVVTKELDHIVVASRGRVSSTRLETDEDLWRVATAAKTAVFWLQSPQKPFEAMTASLVA